MTIRLGTVARFDAHVGLGEIEEATGTRFPFHCTAITDGTRTIDQGRSVGFLVGPGGPGVWEAVSVVPLN
ncbi:MAG: cold-shock protein [Actinomycetota bacterium]